MIGCVVFGTAPAEETFRCGSKLDRYRHDAGRGPGALRRANVRSVEEQDVRSGNQVVGKTKVHRWIYESYSSTRTLVFDQDRLTSIE
jgi:hypothetical protein